MKYAAAAFLLSFVATSAQAQDVRSWGQDTVQAYGACSIVGSAALLMGTVQPDDFDKSRRCADTKLEQAREAYAVLPPQTKPQAAAALKDYYAAWIAAMKSLPSRLAGTPAAADRTWSSTKQRLDELWARFEIEAGL